MGRTYKSIGYSDNELGRGWGFWDETWGNFLGFTHSPNLAKAELLEYLEMLNMPKRTCVACGCPIDSINEVTIEEFSGLCLLCYRKQPKMVSIDLDGVLAKYRGWAGSNNIGPPIPGALDFVRALHGQGLRVVVFTTRGNALFRGSVKKWLDRHGFGPFILRVTDIKNPSVVYIDDRAIHFDGSFDGLFEKVVQFKPHWKD